MLQKLICHFSIKMLKIFCLRDTPSAWAQSHGSLDHNENSQIVVNQRIAAWPTLRSFAITIRPCPWSLWELGNNTDQGSILVPEKMGSAFKVFQNSAIWNSPKPLVVCFKLIKGLRKEEVNFENKTCHQCYLLSTMWVNIFQYSKQFAEKNSHVVVINNRKDRVSPPYDRVTISNATDNGWTMSIAHLNKGVD